LVKDMLDAAGKVAADAAERDTAGRVRAHVAEEIAEAIEQGPSCGCVSCRLNMAALARRHARVPAPSVLEVPAGPPARRIAEQWVHAPDGDPCRHLRRAEMGPDGHTYCDGGHRLARPGFALHPDEPHSADGPSGCLTCFLMLGERAAAKAGYRPDGLRIGDEYHPDEPHHEGGPVECMWCRLLTPGASTGTIRYAFDAPQPVVEPRPPAGWGLMVAEEEEPVAWVPWVHWLAPDGDQASPACGYAPDPPHTVESVTDTAAVDCPGCQGLPAFKAEAARRC
jgi:hypothetical protein